MLHSALTETLPKSRVFRTVHAAAQRRSEGNAVGKISLEASLMLATRATAKPEPAALDEQEHGPDAVQWSFDPALRGTNRHAMPAIHHPRSGQEKIRDFREKAGSLGAGVTLQRPCLDHDRVRRPQHHQCTAFLGCQSCQRRHPGGTG